MTTEKTFAMLSPELEEFIRRNEAERTELVRQNNALLHGFIASFEERFPKEPDEAAALKEKRDWFAGQALAGMAARISETHAGRAANAYRQADAMLAERAKAEGKQS